MYISKQDQGIAKFTSRVGMNGGLRNVLIRGKQLVATDSFRLVEVTNKEPDVTECEPMLVPGASLKAVPMLKGDRLNVGEAQLKGAGHEVNADVQQADAFPKYEQIFPTGSHFQIRLDAEFLAEIAKFMSGVDNQVLLTFQADGHKPVVLECESLTRKVRAMLMPIIKSTR